MTQSFSSKNLTASFIPMLATACGVTVANVYLCQPLLSAISKEFSVPSGTAGWVATAAQLGYALGILLVVPLADRADSKRLLRILLACACGALAVAGSASSIYLLVAATFVTTMATVIPQILIPLAVSNADPERAGRVVGTMQSGLIFGILLSRTVSGAVGEYSGSWRNAYFLAAALTGLLFFVLPRFLRSRSADQQPIKLTYAGLLLSLPSLLQKWSGLRLSALLGACIFASFSALWATLAFHLAEPPFGFGPAEAGLFGLWGAAGALIAPFCGRISDKHGPVMLNTLSIASVVLAFAIFISGGGTSVAAVVIGVNLLDFGNQAGQIANQAHIFKLDATARARLNTVYMVATFGGGAIGSAVGARAWAVDGWLGVSITGLALAVFAGAALAMYRVFSGSR